MDELLARIKALQDELDGEYRQAREEWVRKNGGAVYTREVAAPTEPYGCPIKHARRIRAAHDRYPQFFDHGDAHAYQQGLNRLRRWYGDVQQDE